MAKDMDSSNRMHHSNDALMDEAIARLEGIDSGRHRDTAKYKKVLEAIDELHRVTSPFYEKPIGDEDNLWDIRSAYKALVSACDEYAEGKGDKRQSEFGSQRLDSIRAIRDLAQLDSDLFDTDVLEDATSLNVSQLLTKARSITAVIEDPKEVSTVGAMTSSRIPLEVDRGNGPEQGFFTESKVNDTDEVIMDSLVNRFENSSALSPLHKLIMQAERDVKGTSLIGALVMINEKQDPLPAPTGIRAIFSRDREDVMTEGMENFREEVLKAISPVPREFKSTDSFRRWITSDPSIIPALNDLSKEMGSRRLSFENNNLGMIEDFQDVPSRNIGMSRCAELLGCKGLIAKADRMAVQIDGELKTGVFMEKAEGSDLKRPRPSDPLVTLFDDLKMDLEPLSGSFKRDLANMQVIDYICGNPDRHLGNMIYKTGTDENGHLSVTGVVGIDNDLSFGKIPGSKLYFRPENFRVMTRDTAMMVMSMDQAFLDNITADLDLSVEEKQAMFFRASGLKSYLAEPSHIFMYDSSVTPGMQLPYAEGKIIIVNDEKDLQRIPLESLIIPPDPKVTKGSPDSRGNIFYQAAGIPQAVREETKKMYDEAWRQAGKEMESCMVDAGKYVDPVTKKPSRFEDLINSFNTKILETLDKVPPIHYAKTALRGSKQASLSSTPQDPQQSTPQADTGLSPDQKPLRFTPESVAAAQAFRQSAPQPAAQAPQQPDTGLSPDQKPLRFTPESVAAAKSFQKSTPQPTAQAPQPRDTGLSPDQKPLRFTPESVAAAKESAKTSGPNEHTRTKIDLKTLEAKTPKSEAALRAEALAVRKRSRSYAKPPVPQPSVKAAAAAIGK